jgi:hypothetical protein
MVQPLFSQRQRRMSFVGVVKSPLQMPEKSA